MQKKLKIMYTQDKMMMAINKRHFFNIKNKNLAQN